MTGRRRTRGSLGAPQEQHQRGQGQPQPGEDGWPRGLGAPAMRAFSAAGFTTLRSVSGASEAKLLLLHGVGPKAVAVLKAALARAGLALAP